MIFFPKLVFLNILFLYFFVVEQLACKKFADESRKKNYQYFFLQFIFFIFIQSSEMHFDLVTRKISAKLNFAVPEIFIHLKTEKIIFGAILNSGHPLAVDTYGQLSKGTPNHQN